MSEGAPLEQTLFQLWYFFRDEIAQGAVSPQPDVLEALEFMFDVLNEHQRTGKALTTAQFLERFNAWVAELREARAIDPEMSAHSMSGRMARKLSTP